MTPPQTHAPGCCWKQTTQHAGGHSNARARTGREKKHNGILVRAVRYSSDPAGSAKTCQACWCCTASHAVLSQRRFGGFFPSSLSLGPAGSLRGPSRSPAGTLTTVSPGACLAKIMQDLQSWTRDVRCLLRARSLGFARRERRQRCSC